MSLIDNMLEIIPHIINLNDLRFKSYQTLAFLI